MSFDFLMSVFEGNYARLKILIESRHSVGWHGVSRLEGCPDLYLKIDEQHPYTTMLHMSHQFHQNGRIIHEPDTYIKIYHDAKTAEAIQISPGRNVTELLRPWVPGKDIAKRRKELNWFLLKWLDYLLEQGHSLKTFTAVE